MNKDVINKKTKKIYLKYVFDLFKNKDVFKSDNIQMYNRNVINGKKNNNEYIRFFINNNITITIENIGKKPFFINYYLFGITLNKNKNDERNYNFNVYFFNKLNFYKINNIFKRYKKYLLHKDDNDFLIKLTGETKNESVYKTKKLIIKKILKTLYDIDIYNNLSYNISDDIISIILNHNNICFETKQKNFIKIGYKPFYLPKYFLLSRIRLNIALKILQKYFLNKTNNDINKLLINSLPINNVRKYKIKKIF
jgi:hypothetical protein